MFFMLNTLNGKVIILTQGEIDVLKITLPDQNCLNRSFKN